MSNEKSSFGGIFGRLGKLVFTDDYLKANGIENEEKVAVSSPKPTSPTPTNSENSTASVAYNGTPQQEMIDKVHTLVKSINKPGIDFFELWNAAEAMGSVNESTVSNAFVALKIASGNTLSKDIILSTGESYCAELKSALESDVNDKIKMKNKIVDAKNTSHNSLSNEITDLNNKIVEMQNLLKEKNQKLLNIDADFDPKLKEIDEKINNGKLAVDAVVAEMRNVLSLAAKTIKE